MIMWPVVEFAAVGFFGLACLAVGVVFRDLAATRRIREDDRRWHEARSRRR